MKLLSWLLAGILCSGLLGSEDAKATDWMSVMSYAGGYGASYAANGEEPELGALFFNPALFASVQRPFLLMSRGDLKDAERVNIVGIGSLGIRGGWGLGVLEYDSQNQAIGSHVTGVTAGFSLPSKRRFKLGLGIGASYHDLEPSDKVSLSANVGLSVLVGEDANLGLSVRNAVSRYFSRRENFLRAADDLPRSYLAGFSAKMPRVPVFTTFNVAVPQEGKAQLFATCSYGINNQTNVALTIGNEGVRAAVELLLDNSKISLARQVSSARPGQSLLLRHSFGFDRRSIEDSLSKAQVRFDEDIARAACAAKQMMLDSVKFWVASAYENNRRERKYSDLLKALEHAQDSISFADSCFRVWEYEKARRCYGYVLALLRELTADTLSLDSLYNACDFCLKGKASANSGNQSAAVSNYKKALEWCPRTTQAYFELVKAHEAKMLDLEFGGPREVLTANFQSYGTQSFCALRIRNLFPDTLKIIPTFHWPPGFMQRIADVTASSLSPGEEKIFDLTETFGYEDVRRNEFDQSMRLLAIVDVKYRELSMSENKETSIRFRARNVLDWSDPDRFAAFIDPANKSLGEMTKNVLSLCPDLVQGNQLMGRIYQAAAMFNVLTQFRIEYALDAKGASELTDQVTFPPDLISTRRGDCEDLTALYCSMLQSIGIETSAISASNHVFMMFDTGISEIRKARLPFDENRCIVRSGKTYIPIETTYLDSGFVAAWERGVIEYDHFLSLGDLPVIDLRKAWSRYEPFPVETPYPSSVPDSASYCMSLAQQRAEIDSLISEDNSRLRADSERQLRLITAQALNDSALQMIDGGNFKPAKEFLTRAVALDVGNDGLLCNFANVCAILGEPRESNDAIFKLADSTYMASQGAHNVLLCKVLSMKSGSQAERDKIKQLILNLQREYHYPDTSSDLKMMMWGCLDNDRLDQKQTAACIAQSLSEFGRDQNQVVTSAPLSTGAEANSRWFKWYRRAE